MTHVLNGYEFPNKDFPELKFSPNKIKQLSMVSKEPVSYEQFLTKDACNHEDSEKFKEYIPKLEKYRKALASSIKPEYSIAVPASANVLADQQFNAVAYLYKEKLLTPREFEITDTNSPQLIQKISSGAWSSVEVFKAFAKRGTIAHQLTNCAMEIFTDEGLKRAEYLDEYYAKHNKTIGPLHGLPISLKEHYKYKDKVCHASFVSLIDEVSDKHAVTIQILENLGAVFYVRTNQPQCLMHLCSDNNFTGITKCPYNVSLTAGGSSSGEGAMIAFGGAVAGVGSDIGGSIRSPAAFSGCFGLRPSTKRISLLGSKSSFTGLEGILGVCGPLGRTIDDLEIWMDAYINQGKPWELDYECLMMPWRKVSKPKLSDLTIAVIYDDGLVKPTPPIARALKETVAKLKAAGANVIDFKPFKTQEAADIINLLYNCDGNIKAGEYLSKSGEPVKKLSKWYLNYGKGSTPLTVYETHLVIARRDNLRQEYHEYLAAHKIDFILSPTYSNVAPKPAEIYNWSYTSLFNILDLPTLVFQTGLYQDPELDQWDESFQNYEFRSDLEKLELDNYKHDEFVGAPIGLQLSGLHYHDEEVIAAGKSIVEIL